MLKKCVAITTGVAAATIGKYKGAPALIKQRSPDCKFLHWLLHHEALASQKLRGNSSDKVSELEKLMSDGIGIRPRPKAKTSRLFSKLCDKCLQIIKLCFYIVKFDGYHEEKFCKDFSC